MINGTLVTILSIGILILLSNLYKNIEPMGIISSKKYKAKSILNTIENLLDKLKYKKQYIRFQEYDDIQRNKTWQRHVAGDPIWKKKKEGDEEKIFKLYIYKIMIRKEIPIMIMWLAILLFLGYSYSKLEPMQNRKYKQHYKSNQIRKYSIIKNI